MMDDDRMSPSSAQPSRPPSPDLMDIDPPSIVI